MTQQVIIYGKAPGEALPHLEALALDPRKYRVTVFLAGGLNKAERGLLRQHGWTGRIGGRAEAAKYASNSASGTVMVPAAENIREFLPDLPEPPPPEPVSRPSPPPPRPAPKLVKRTSTTPVRFRAAFLVATHHRPQLLQHCLTHLIQQQVPDGWAFEILVGGVSDDEGRHLVSGFPDARFIAVPSSKVTDKLNLLARHTNADLLLMADDDDLQPTNRLAAAAAAFEAGADWSAAGQHTFVHLPTGKVARWAGPANKGWVGTTVSVRRDLFMHIGGYPSVPRDKDGHLAYRIRTGKRGAVFHDLDEQLGFGVVCTQHTANIQSRRPFPAQGQTTRRGPFRVTGMGLVREDVLPAQARETLRKLRVGGRLKAHVTITSFERPDEALAALHKLATYTDSVDLHVHLYDDCSRRSYKDVSSFLRSKGWSYTRFPKNHGKRGYFHVVQKTRKDAREHDADFYFFVQDDIRLCQRFFTRATDLWNRLPADKGTFYLLMDSGDQSRWTTEPLQRMGDFERTGWVDCAAFMHTKRAFPVLLSMTPPPGRWFASHRGSGTGRQMTRALRAAGLGMYRASRSLVDHSESESVMNPRIRSAQKIRARGFVDLPAMACMATIPQRVESLPRVVAALLPQVDRLCVYLNGHERVPPCLQHPKVVVARSQDHGDRGDAGKFFWIGEHEGIYLTVDDDIIYPPDYVGHLLMKIDQYKQAVVVGVHGSMFRDPFESYERSRRVLHYRHALDRDTTVHALGTGTVAFHTSTIQVRREDFEAPNMADIWFARLGQVQGVPFVAVERPGGWLGDVPYTESIYDASKARSGSGADQGALRDKVAGAVRWRLGRTKHAVRRKNAG